MAEDELPPTQYLGPAIFDEEDSNTIRFLLNRLVRQGHDLRTAPLEALRNWVWQRLREEHHNDVAFLKHFTDELIDSVIQAMRQEKTDEEASA